MFERVHFFTNFFKWADRFLQKFIADAAQFYKKTKNCFEFFLHFKIFRSFLERNFKNKYFAKHLSMTTSVLAKTNLLNFHFLISLQFIILQYRKQI